MFPSQVNDLFRSSRIAASGLKSSRTWMNMISNNISNMHTLDSGRLSRDGNYIPYARQLPLFAKVLSEKFRKNQANGDVINGVHVKDVIELEGDVKKVYDPAHPAARKPGSADAGYVYYPNISVAQEMADLRIASAAYEANLSVIAVSGKMNQQALSIAKSA
jgi:flagellar basal-body rod protein FlgC